jgi:hypothetical protein
MKVAVHRVESVADEVDAMQRQIASRAEELHDSRGGGQPIDDWLAAITAPLLPARTPSGESGFWTREGRNDPASTNHIPPHPSA